MRITRMGSAGRDECAENQDGSHQSGEKNGRRSDIRMHSKRDWLIGVFRGCTDQIRQKCNENKRQQKM